MGKWVLADCAESLDSSSLALKQKGTATVRQFCVFAEDRLVGIKQSESVSKFDMSRLETEYDYETEHEQIRQSQRMLAEDLADAIDFFVTKDPLQLVENL